MKKITLIPGEKQPVFVGIDQHKKQWHVTIRTEDTEIFSGSISGTWEALKQLLTRRNCHHVHAVYEAGYFGFWLHDKLIQHGAKCIVTPPPQA